MAAAALTVATTITGGSAFGSTWRSTMAMSPIPMDCDASMNGRGRMVSTTERITAATRGVYAMATARMIELSEEPRTATKASASRKPGKASRMSLPARISRSSQPPK